MAVVADAVVARFSSSLAQSAAEVREAQQLRYRIFAEEMGADIDGGSDGIDADRFDPYCDHLLVRNAAGQVVASTRLLSDARAAEIGEFYSEHEFEMDAIRQLDGRKLEVGRTCVDADYRTGSTIAVLWSGLADYVADRQFDYLFGCASIPLDHTDDAQRVINVLHTRYLSAPDLRVAPRVPLPLYGIDFDKVRMPPLLKAYVSLGARACGKPFWDKKFACADVFMLLNLRELHPRYARRFLGPRLAARRARTAG